MSTHTDAATMSEKPSPAGVGVRYESEKRRGVVSSTKALTTRFLDLLEAALACLAWCLGAEAFHERALLGDDLLGRRGDLGSFRERVDCFGSTKAEVPGRG